MRIDLLEPGTWWTLTPTLGMPGWRLCRTSDDWLVAESPPVGEGGPDLVQSLAALAWGGSGQGEPGSRLSLDESGQLRLQACLALGEADDLPQRLIRWQADLRAMEQALALAATAPPADLTSWPSWPEDKPDEDTEQAAAPMAAQQLMQRLYDRLAEDPLLSPWLDFEPEQARLALAPEAAAWAVFMQPGPWPDSVECLLPLDFVPQDKEAAQALLQQCLRTNSALVLGPQASLGLSADGEQLLLQSWVRPDHEDSMALRSHLGLLVGLSEALGQDEDTAPANGPQRMDHQAQELWQHQSRFLRV